MTDNQLSFDQGSSYKTPVSFERPINDGLTRVESFVKLRLGDLTLCNPHQMRRVLAAKSVTTLP
jgi:hypothetical protein